MEALAQLLVSPSLDKEALPHSSWSRTKRDGFHCCRGPLDGGGGSGRVGKRSKQPLAQLVEVDIPGAPAVPQRAPVAPDASVDPYIGRHIMWVLTMTSTFGRQKQQFSWQ